jgi:hypothetical protein
MELQNDPIINTIEKGIKRDIQIALDNHCLRAAVILIFAGMDAMAFLSMPVDKNDVRREDFISWTAKYIKFPCKEQLTGEDLYGLLELSPPFHRDNSTGCLSRGF